MRFSHEDPNQRADANLSGIPREDPLEALLDQESDEAFGAAVFKDEELLNGATRVRLAEWTAQDFSSIYVRFRPHLERHARRFLSNPSQVDEVVQDAFLYLMVSLPELDSEIGVLRFLKWKTRLLALDVIRASGRAYVNSIDDIPEPESSDPEVSTALEQQDDAAVVRLALSKLNPRHREVLIASMYEEKSTEQISKQVGLSENATRQLIFRARSAFKKALIGDVDTTGMSAAAILSVAARKAAAEGKKVGASALALIALVVMSLSVWPAFNRGQEDQIAGPAPTSKPEASAPVPTPGTSATPASPEPTPELAEPDSEAPGNTKSSAASEPTPKAPTPSPAPSVLGTDFGAIFDTTKSASLFVLDETYVVSASNGLSAEFVFNQTREEPFAKVLATIQVGETMFTVYPDSSETYSAVDNDGLKRFIYLGTMKYVYDDTGKVWSESDLAKGTFRIDVILDPNGISVKQVLLTLISGN